MERYKSYFREGMSRGEIDALADHIKKSIKGKITRDTIDDFIYKNNYMKIYDLSPMILSELYDRLKV